MDNDQSLPTAIQLTVYMLTETGEYYIIKLQTKHAKANFPGPYTASCLGMRAHKLTAYLVQLLWCVQAVQDVLTHVQHLQLLIGVA